MAIVRPVQFDNNNDDDNSCTDDSLERYVVIGLMFSSNPVE